MEKTVTKFMRRSEVQAVTGLPTSTLYQRISKGTFPKPIQLGPRAVGWVEAEIEEWQQARIAERDGAGA